MKEMKKMDRFRAKFMIRGFGRLFGEYLGEEGDFWRIRKDGHDFLVRASDVVMYEREGIVEGSQLCVIGSRDALTGQRGSLICIVRENGIRAISESFMEQVKESDGDGHILSILGYLEEMDELWLRENLDGVVIEIGR